ncbi:transporter [Nitrospira sp. Kam-Ns4a]
MVTVITTIQVAARSPRRQAYRFAVLLVLLLASAPGPSWSADQPPNWQVGLAGYYSSGTYGTGSRTDITAVPLSIRRLFDNGDVTLIVSYLWVTGDCNVTLLSGVPNATGGTCPTRTVVRGGKVVQERTTATRVTQSGIGDTLLQGRYYLLDEKGLLPTVAVLGRVKFPTADPDKGLGTGEFDEKFGLQVSKTLPERWITFADVGYTFIGSPPGVELKNQWNYDLGLGYYFTPNLLGSVYYEYWSAVLAGLQDPQDIYFDLSYKLGQTVRLNAGFLVGLSAGAPDYGLTGGLAIRF